LERRASSRTRKGRSKTFDRRIVLSEIDPDFGPMRWIAASFQPPTGLEQ
jgi:hypothetical protein